MAKLFVFGIGGTGARVIKSLTMLLAAGVDVKSTEIVPIIIDVDKPNEDLTRTIEILGHYQTIQQKINRPGIEGFFKTEIKNLYPIAGRDFRMEIEDAQGKNFEDYIDYETLTGTNKKLAELLFSKSNLELDMQKGFKGNPNLGSVVLNQFVSNPDFYKFALDFAPGDRIFIISSIHGGTGSSGFPLLVKNLRNAQVPLPNPEDIKKSMIGAVTVLPYFKLRQGEIKSEDFISKAKAALEYYYNNVNPSLNSLYYIGFNDSTPNYDNHAGGKDQKNPAHFVELAAAISVIDFANQSDSNIAQTGQRFLEFGVNDFQTTIDFPTLGTATRKIIQTPLIKYFYFKNYLDYHFNETIGKQPWSNRGKVKITKSSLPSDSDFSIQLRKFNNRFDEWLSELGSNKPSFKPFNLSNAREKLLDCIVNVNVYSGNGWKNDSSLFDDYLNSVERKTTGLSVEQKFIEIFNLATERLLNK